MFVKICIYYIHEKIINNYFHAQFQLSEFKIKQSYACFEDDKFGANFFNNMFLALKASFLLKLLTTSRTNLTQMVIYQWDEKIQL